MVSDIVAISVLVIIGYRIMIIFWFFRLDIIFIHVNGKINDLLI
jgi:hypothetical protein